ncbi:MAG: thioredoxin domain-containing protein [Chloroflexota bacterium]
MAKRQKPPTSKKQSTSWWVYLGFILIAVLIAWVLIRSYQSPDIVPASVEDSYREFPRGMTDEGFPYLGSLEAPLTLTIYEDFGCTNCKQLFEGVEPALLGSYVASGEVLLVVYTMAFVNSQSLPAAEAVECAREQDKFWEYRYVLFTHQGTNAFTRDNLINWAELLGLDRKAFANCFDQARYRSKVLTQSQISYQFGIQVTPTIELAGLRYEGWLPFDSDNPDQPGLHQIIEQALEKGKP